MFKSRKQYSYEEVLTKLMGFCAYQERSPYEVKLKAINYGLSKEESAQIVDTLIKDRFVNEDRFTKAYIRGKVSIKRWGTYKIREGLLSKGIPERVVEKHLNQVPAETHFKNAQYWFKRKVGDGVQKLTQEDKSKLYRYLAQKGFESDLIKNLLFSD